MKDKPFLNKTQEKQLTKRIESQLKIKQTAGGLAEQMFLIAKGFGADFDKLPICLKTTIRFYLLSCPVVADKFHKWQNGFSSFMESREEMALKSVAKTIGYSILYSFNESNLQIMLSNANVETNEFVSELGIEFHKIEQIIDVICTILWTHHKDILQKCFASGDLSLNESLITDIKGDIFNIYSN